LRSGVHTGCCLRSTTAHGFAGTLCGYDLLQLHLPKLCLHKCGPSWNVYTVRCVLREMPTLKVCDMLSAGYKTLSRDLQITVFLFPFVSLFEQF